MSRSRLSDEQCEAMRERILDAARELLVTEGPEAITTRAIAGRVGVSHMTLYTYFDNHAAILTALKQRQRARFQSRLDGLLHRAASEDVAQVMLEWLQSHVTMAVENPRVFRFLWLLRPDVDRTRQARGERMSVHLRSLSRLVEIGIERRTFAPRDPTVAAATAFSMVLGPMLLYHGGHIISDTLRDQMASEALGAALAYLRGDTDSGTPAIERNAT